ncbi:MAG: hypothetical protein HQM16_02950 [Deltaproteobacteria bacterium]|nr:hypothetical protein [Deltaproteobacteria bacterium]
MLHSSEILPLPDWAGELRQHKTQGNSVSQPATKNTSKWNFDFQEKNQSTCFEESSQTASKQFFIKRILTDLHHWGHPQDCPHNQNSHHFSTPQADLVGSTTYGGPGSKYININEDSFFFGINSNQKTIAGVIDGAGGSQNGYLAGSLANRTISHQLLQGQGFDTAFETADKILQLSAHGGYATGVSVMISRDLHVEIGNKGDARALTIRQGAILKVGTSVIQSEVARKIREGHLPAHAIHTSDRKNIIYCAIGKDDGRHAQTAFKGRPGDIVILGSDGLFDLVSDYEILCLSDKYKTMELHQELNKLAYQRNNSTTPFTIKLSPHESHILPPLYIENQRQYGDNITIMVVELK